MFGNTPIDVTGFYDAASAMSGGTGYGIDLLNLTATMGDGTNFLGVGAGGSGQSNIYGNLTYTGGAGNDTVAIQGAFIGGNVTATLAAGDATTGDSFILSDDLAESPSIAGTLTVTQTDGLSTIRISSADQIGSPVYIGGVTSINVGNSTSGTPTATFRNVQIDGAFTYTGGTGADAVNFLGSANFGDAVTINLGAGANSWTTTGTQEVQTLTPSDVSASGTFKLSYGGVQTGAIDYDATLLEIQAWVNTLPGCESVTVGGNTLDVGGDMTFTFGANDGDVLPLTADVSALATAVPGPVTASIVETTKGSNYEFASITGAALTYTGGAAADTVTLGGRVMIDGAATFTLGTSTAGDSANSMTAANVVADGAFTITGGTGGDNITLGAKRFLGRGAFSATLYAGANVLSMDNADVTAFTYTGLADGDALTIGATSFTDAGAFTVGVGDGANSLTMANATITGAIAYTGGAGNDNVNIGGGWLEAKSTVSFTMGAGTNAVTLNGRSKNVTYGGTGGTNALTMGTSAAAKGYTLVGNLAFTGGTGANQLDFDGSLRGLTYVGGAAADTINLGAGANAYFLASAAVNVNGAAGANALTIKNGSIRGADTPGNGLTYTGGADGDTLNFGQGGAAGVRVYKGVLINLGNGANFANIDNSVFNSTSGSFVLNGGTGVDTIAFDVAGSSRTVFARAATIAGAGGADIFTDRSVLGSAGTEYLGRTAATKLAFTGFRNASAQINGSTTGTVHAGAALVTPSYA